MSNFTTHLDSIGQWIGSHAVNIAIAIGAGFLLFTLLVAAKGVILKLAGRIGGDHFWATLICDTVRKTRLWFLAVLAARLVYGYANTPEMVGQTVRFVFVVAATFQGAIWARTFILGLIRHRAGNGEREDSQLASAMAIIQLLVSFAVFAIALIFVLDNLGVNVTGLVAGLGVGGIAIGLAAQGIFSDLFAALSILFDRPFQVGDTITYQGKEGPVTGQVERIGLKSTRIRALTGELRIFANAKLLEQELTNFAGRTRYRMTILAGVIYQTDPDLADTIPDIMREIVERQGHTFVRSAFTGFGPSSLDFEMVFEVTADEVAAAKTAYQKVALDILRQFNRRGIAFAYPTQTTFTAAPDGTMIMPYPDRAIVPVAVADGKSSDASP